MAQDVGVKGTERLAAGTARLARGAVHTLGDICGGGAQPLREID